VQQYVSQSGFDYHQNVMGTASPAKLKKIVLPESEATPQQTPVREVDEKPDLISSAPERGAIARLAYGYWLDRRDTGEGSADEDWFRAEQELVGNGPVR
jgi:hypothetical protein